MSSEVTESKLSVIKPIARFGGGLAIGAFFVCIPIAYSSVSELSPVQIGVALAIVLGCGVAVGRWGEKFVDILAGIIESAGF
jgi:prolipoprotein diacylglyceryltransferase